MKDDRVLTWEEFLANMEQRGVSLYLDGHKTEPGEIVRKCSVCETSVYMPDFVLDEEGRLKEVRYDEVKDW